MRGLEPELDIVRDVEYTLAADQLPMSHREIIFIDPSTNLYRTLTIHWIKKPTSTLLIGHVYQSAPG